MSRQIKFLDVTSEQDLDPLALIFSETLVDMGPFFPLGLTPTHIAWRRNELSQILNKIKQEEESGERNRPPYDQIHLVKAVKIDTNEIIGLLLYKMIPDRHEKEGTVESQAVNLDSKVVEKEKKFPDEVDESWPTLLKYTKGLRDQFMGKRAYVSIDLLLVKSEHRGQGIGTSLIKHCLQSVASLKSAPKDFFLTAAPLAKPIYERLGFKPVTHPLEDPNLSDEEKGWWPSAMVTVYP